MLPVCLYPGFLYPLGGVQMALKFAREMAKTNGQHLYNNTQNTGIQGDFAHKGL